MQNISIMFKSPRFLAGFIVVLLVVAFAIFYPMYDTRDPKESRVANQNYGTVATLREAVASKDKAAVRAEMAALADNTDAEIVAMLANMQQPVEDEKWMKVEKALKAIKKTTLIAKDQPPSAAFPLGTDNFSTDMLLKLAYGTRTSLLVGLMAGIIATIIGLALGLFAGFVGGMVDNIITAFTNMFIVIPTFIVLILISVALGNNSNTLITGLVIGLTAWPWTARAVRAQTTSLRNRDHVNMARITGYSTTHIIISEILPYIASYVVMAFILQVASGIMNEATIAILGLGDPTSISLGKLINWAMQYEAVRSGRWWQFVPVAALIAATTFGLYMMNSGMDEVFNPKIRS